MFCPKCGASIVEADAFCAKCGAASRSVPVTPTGAAAQPAASLTPPAILTIPPPKPSTVARDITVVLCILLSVIAIIAFHVFAALLAVCSITVGALVVSSRIGAKAKLIFVCTAVALVLAINIFEGWNAEKEKQERAETQRRQTQQAIDNANRAREAFAAMSPAEHLAKVKSLLVLTASPQQIAEGEKHFAAIPSGTTEAGEASGFKRQFDATKRVQDEKNRKAAEKAAKERTAAEALVKRALRDAMAQTLENKLLDEGYNVTVTAIGPDHTTLHLRWILVSKVLAHKLSQEGDFFENARALGFKRVEITDGYDETWFWKL